MKCNHISDVLSTSLKSKVFLVMLALVAMLYWAQMFTYRLFAIFYYMAFSFNFLLYYEKMQIPTRISKPDTIDSPISKLFDTWTTYSSHLEFFIMKMYPSAHS